MKTFTLRRIETRHVLETTKTFEINSVPFKSLTRTHPFTGETESEFIEYLDTLLDLEVDAIGKLYEELDELGFLDIADSLDMLLYSATTEICTELDECWIENEDGESESETI